MELMFLNFLFLDFSIIVCINLCVQVRTLWAICGKLEEDFLLVFLRTIVFSEKTLLCLENPQTEHPVSPVFLIFVNIFANHPGAQPQSLKILLLSYMVSYFHVFVTRQFSLVQSLSRVQLFETPMDCSTPGLPVHH